MRLHFSPGEGKSKHKNQCQGCGINSCNWSKSVSSMEQTIPMFSNFEVDTFYLRFYGTQMRTRPFPFTAHCTQVWKIKVTFSWHFKSYNPDLPSLETSAVVLHLDHRHTLLEACLLLDIHHPDPVNNKIKIFASIRLPISPSKSVYYCREQE